MTHAKWCKASVCCFSLRVYPSHKEIICKEIPWPSVIVHSRDVGAELAECLPGLHETLGLIPAQHKAGVVAHSCHLVEAGGSE